MHLKTTFSSKKCGNALKKAKPFSSKKMSERAEKSKPFSSKKSMGTHPRTNHYQ